MFDRRRSPVQQFRKGFFRVRAPCIISQAMFVDPKVRSSSRITVVFFVWTTPAAHGDPPALGHQVVSYANGFSLASKNCCGCGVCFVFFTCAQCHSMLQQTMLELRGICEQPFTPPIHEFFQLTEQLLPTHSLRGTGRDIKLPRTPWQTGCHPASFVRPPCGGRTGRRAPKTHP